MIFEMKEKPTLPRNVFSHEREDDVHLREWGFGAVGHPPATVSMPGKRAASHLIAWTEENPTAHFPKKEKRSQPE
jgi:hypothetical protein